MSKRPMGHGPLKYMRDFKAVSADFEYYLTLSDKPVSICLTERQMYILSVWNTYTPWMTRWYNTEDTSAAQLAIIAAEIENLLMCGCGIPVPSITDTINTNTYITNTSNEYITNNTTYTSDDDTLITLAPNMTYATGEPADIDRILCFGYGMLLQTVINQGKGVKQLEGEQAQNLVQHIGIAMTGLAGAGTLAITAGGFAATVVSVIGGPWALLGLAVGGIAVGIASLFVGADASLFDDQEAIDHVLCTMRENSLGNEPTFEIFSGLLEPNTFETGSNAEKLAALVQPFLDSIDFYLQFMISMSELYSTPLLVALPECEVCPTTEICEGGESVDFRVTNGSFTPFLGRAEYFSGEGWGVDPLVHGGRISIIRAMAPTPTKIRMSFTGDIQGVRIYDYNGDIVSLAGSTAIGEEQPDGSWLYEIEDLGAIPDDVLIDVGGATNLPEEERFLWVCWNYD